jgi:hypothetical protein
MYIRKSPLPPATPQVIEVFRRRLPASLCLGLPDEITQPARPCENKVKVAEATSEADMREQSTPTGLGGASVSEVSPWVKAQAQQCKRLRGLHGAEDREVLRVEFAASEATADRHRHMRAELAQSDRDLKADEGALGMPRVGMSGTSVSERMQQLLSELADVERDLK